MSQCSNCQDENLSDSPLCNECRTRFRFTHRVDCDCQSCAPQVVEINGLSEPTEFTLVDSNYRPISGEIDINPDYEAWWAARESMQY